MDQKDKLSGWSSRRNSSSTADEEAAVQWAALESLSGNLRTSIEAEAEYSGGLRQKHADFSKLGLDERRLLLDDILKKAGNEDNTALLKKLRRRIDRVGIELPTTEIKFENLTVEAKCYVGSRAMPTLINELKNIVELIFGLVGIRFSKMATFNILKNVSGIIKPSRMTLLLGPPSSGKTTFLLALAGKLDPSLKMGGDITYNGYKLSEFVPQKTSTYISQNDVHTAEMTVKETLNFSAKCQGVGDRHELLSELVRREEAQGIVPETEVDLFMTATSTEGVQNHIQTEYTLRILGLDKCADTIIGNQMLRGVSGGQKKRVTTGEMIVGPTKTLFMDEISTGLDSSTTHNVVKCLQQVVGLGEATIVMSLLQPTPETFDLFDDIVLLSEGQIVYQGSRKHVLRFFEICGFKCPQRKAVANFLQEITSKNDQQHYWADESKAYQFVSAAEFSKRFKQFRLGKHMQKHVSIPFDKAKGHRAALVFTKRSASLKQLLQASFNREWILLKRNFLLYLSKAIQLTIMALITATVFLRTNMRTRTETDGAIYIGAIGYGLTVSLAYCFSEQALIIYRLPVFYKQRDLLLYPTWVFTLPNCIIKIPISLMESAIWVIVTYYSIGFAPEPTRFFKQLLLLSVFRETGGAMFKAIAGVGRSISVSNTFGCIVTVIVISLSGIIVPKALLPKWWIWGYWMSPMKHAFTALAVNEMLSPKWMNSLDADGRRLGIAILENINVTTDESWYWKSIIVLLGYAVLFNVLFTVFLAYLNPLGKPKPVISKKAAADMKSRRSSSTKNEKKLVKSYSECMVINKKEARNNTSAKGMSLPFTPLAMSFKEVNYYISMPPKLKEQGVEETRLQLLKGISGAFRPGTITALMGESGAGKTTLMDVLAGRKTSGYIEGDIRIAGYPKKHTTFARVSGYCEQFDVHSSQLTVAESLIFSALLRLPKEVNLQDKYRFLNEVMELVELDNIKGALVGIPGINGLSIEQRKRLTIAVELVANPSIIFMDEPTSGLDARSAAIVMRTVRNIANSGRTVVCTIHQPSIDIFESFDELFLMKRGGQVTYSGPLGENSQELIKYFEEIPGVKKIDKRNPAEWVLEESSIATEARLGLDFAEIYASSIQNKRNMQLVSELSKPVPGSSDLYFPTRYPQSSLQQLKLCLWKYYSMYWRNPDYNLSRFSMSLIISLVTGIFFWKIGQHRDTLRDLTSIIGTMYLALLFIGYGNRTTVQPFTASERQVFYREKATEMYSAFPYALSQVIIELPYVFFQALSSVLILYSMMSFQWTTMKFIWFFIIFFLTILGFTYMGMLCVAISPNVQVAVILSSSFFLMFHLFAGFFIPRPALPKWWGWYYWLNPVSWALYGFIITQYGDMRDMIKVPGQADQQIRDVILTHYGYKEGYTMAVIAALLAFTILFAFMYCVCIRTLNFQRR